MTISKAVSIIQNIDSDLHTEYEKLLAIKTILNLATHNSVTKADLLIIARWFFKNCVEETDKPQTHYDEITAMSIKGMENFIRSISLGFDPWCDRHCKMQGEDNCNTCLAKWLESEVHEDESTK